MFTFFSMIYHNLRRIFFVSDTDEDKPLILVPKIYAPNIDQAISKSLYDIPSKWIMS